MADARIRIYPCIYYMQTRQVEKTVRDILFGKGMKLFPGGWSFLDRDRLLKQSANSGRIRTADAAFERGVEFMRDAQKQWEGAGQKTQLFPLSGGFKLVRREATEITAGPKKLGFRLAWNVLALPGRDSHADPTVDPRFLVVENAEIVLYVLHNGKVPGGNAHWRLTAAAKSVSQQVLPEAFVAHVNAARSDSGRESSGHEHGTSGADTGLAYMHYAMGTRTEFRNFIDPYLRYLDGAPHGHTPALVVPVTKFGVHAEILTRARRVGRVSDGMAEVEVIPWVNLYDGAKLAGRGNRIRGHWTLHAMDDPPDKRPKRISLNGSLFLRGLYEIALTVQTPLGGIAHTHLNMCTALSPTRSYNPNEPVS